MTFKIYDITEWDICRSQIENDAQHMGENYHILLGEAEEKRDWLETEGGDGLPYVCEADDIDEALEKYNEEFYCGEYVQAVEADYEVEGGVE